VISAPASLPSEPHDTPLTASGAGPTSQQCWSARCGRTTRDASHHAHGSEESVWPLIFGGVTPINQWRDTTQHVGHKTTRELLPLASFSHILSYRFLKYTHQPKAQRYRPARPGYIPAPAGYQDWVSIHSISSKTCTYFPFFQKV
jgi:hypothetical protein